MTVPAVGKHIEFYPFEGGKINVFNRNTGKTFLIGSKEASVISKLDGVREVGDVQKECPFYTVEEITGLITALDGIGLFKAEKKKFNPFKIKKSVCNPNRLFKSGGLLTKLLYYFTMVVNPLILILGIISNYTGFFGMTQGVDAAAVTAEYTKFGITDFMIIFLISIVCLAIHELAHTIAARFFRVSVPEIGIMLYYFMPVAYTNISGINLLPGRKQRLAVLSAGTFANIGIIGACYFLMSLTDARTAAFLLAVIVVNGLTVFANGMIFLKFDGYYMAEVLFDEPKLREKASAHLKEFTAAMISKDKTIIKNFRKHLAENPEEQLTHVAYCVFAVISSLYIPIVLVNAVISVISL